MCALLKVGAKHGHCGISSHSRSMWEVAGTVGLLSLDQGQLWLSFCGTRLVVTLVDLGMLQSIRGPHTDGEGA